MWLTAADAPQDSQTAIILGVIGLLTAVLVAVATGVFSLLSARQGRTAPSPPAPAVTAPDLAFRDHVIGELAVARRRDDDNDERDDVQDHRHEVSDDRHERSDGRLDLIETYLTNQDPDWRRP